MTIDKKCRIELDRHALSVCGWALKREADRYRQYASDDRNSLATRAMTLIDADVLENTGDKMLRKL